MESRTSSERFIKAIDNAAILADHCLDNCKKVLSSEQNYGDYKTKTLYAEAKVLKIMIIALGNISIDADTDEVHTQAVANELTYLYNRLHEVLSDVYTIHLTITKTLFTDEVI